MSETPKPGLYKQIWARVLITCQEVYSEVKNARLLRKPVSLFKKVARLSQNTI